MEAVLHYRCDYDLVFCMDISFPIIDWEMNINVVPFAKNRDYSPVSLFIFSGDDGQAAGLQGGGNGTPATAIV
ncbi:hypothetical protein MRB53_016471 [Persea americana]|uniref:Uncharacterized protein n=1 Tax=Persea americana TaxID=3435 RepID=A0ACC2M207_PERAE|nr:hypothetical protein MRB53_016471 [Persea americana]